MDTSKIFNVFNEAMQVYNNFEQCSVQSSFNDVVTFCNNNPDSCSGQSLFENMTKNMFLLMGQVTSLTTIANEFPADNATDLYT